MGDERNDRRHAGVPAPGVDRDLTDHELVEVWEATTSGVGTGDVEMFDDKHELIRSLLRRLGR